MVEQNFTPTIEDLGKKWGISYGQALATIVVMEKQLAAQAETIRQLTASEAALAERIKELEAAKMERPPAYKDLPLEGGLAASTNLSAEAAEIARAGKDIIAGAVSVLAADGSQGPGAFGKDLESVDVVRVESELIAAAKRGDS